MALATSPREITVEMPPLLGWQREVLASPARFRVLAIGRRGGKTMFGAASALAIAAEGKRAWWVAPTYQIAQVGWRAVKRLARQIPGATIRESDRMVVLPGSGWVQVRSADSPDSLRGEGLDLVVVDEAAFVAEEAWTEALRPALADRQGQALIISTPKGLNWFWQAFERGRDPLQSEWQSWQLPTTANPLIAPSEIDEARRTLPERVFSQEFEAAFISDEGAVFRRVRDAATLSPEPPQSGHAYVVGCDWGKSNDFSVFSVVDATAKRMVWLDRSNRVDYQVQIARLKALCDRYRPAGVIAERNSIGEPIIEQLLRLRLPVVPWTATNASKSALIERLQLAFEQGAIQILNEPVLISELQAFEGTRLPGGLMRYSAPEGQHDDCVISLGLAWLGASLPSQRPTLREFGFEAG
jgi:phage terminase large subunit-like protein